MIANLKKGSLSIKSKDGKQQFDVTGGLVEVLKNKVIVLV
jgi:F0F1-type ATP synthase epsilon subunit